MKVQITNLGSSTDCEITVVDQSIVLHGGDSCVLEIDSVSLVSGLAAPATETTAAPAAPAV